MNHADYGFIASLHRPSEGLSGEARRVVKQVPGPVILSPLSLLEIRNALNLAIRRGEMGEVEREAILADIRRQMDAGFFRMAEVSQSEMYAKAGELSDRDTAATATRSLDLMHVGAALLYKARRFLSTDTRQREAATAEGLEVKP